MPPLLKKQSIQLLEACKEAFFLALVGFGIPRQCEFREPICRGSAEIGLLGACVEQSMSACLVQTFGGDILLQTSGQYKSARQILKEFRELLRNPPPRAKFLTDGMANVVSHREELFAASEQLAILITARAGGLHAGVGVAQQVFAKKAQDVHAFLLLLAKSARIKLYLSDLATPPTEIKEQAVLIEDLVQSMTTATTVQERATLIANIFLVLPDIPKDKPEWLDALRRVSVAPKDKDIIFLLDTLHRAKPTILRKSASTGEYFPVKIDPSNPNSIPIDLHMVKKAYTKLKDQWHADANNANGRIDGGILHLPPDDFVLKLFATGLEYAGILDTTNGGKLSHVDTWCFIASSLSVQGTPRPLWFLVRRTEDLKQLEALLKRASQLGNARLKSALAECLPGLHAIAKNASLPSTDALMARMKSTSDTMDDAREKLLALAEDQDDLATGQLFDDLRKVSNQEMDLGRVLSNVMSDNYDIEQDRLPYWARKLCESCTEPEDAAALVEVLQRDDLQQAHTAARKGLAIIDFLSFGPAAKNT